MPDFTRVINLAYQRILGRPADPGGLDAYNRSMNGGLTEAEMRESLLRSAEYASKHPSRSDVSAAATDTSSSSPSSPSPARTAGETATKSASRATRTRARRKKTKTKTKSRARKTE